MNCNDNVNSALDDPKKRSNSLEWLKARAAKAKENLAGKEFQKSKVEKVHLPLWPDAERGVPNSILRSALFGISRTRDQYVVSSSPIPCAKGVSITFQGPRLNQTDLDVWETLVHMARRMPVGDALYFSARDMLKMLSRQYGKAQRIQLNEEIRRLSVSSVEITCEGKRAIVFDTMISRGERDDDVAYSILLMPEMLDLYRNNFTRINWNERQELGNSNLAKWLHGFYSTHETPFSYKVSTILELCGADAGQRLGDFRKLLRTALNLVKNNTSVIANWAIDEHDLVVVTRHAGRQRGPV